MHIDKAVICIAGSSFALQLPVPVRTTTSYLCYSQPSTIQLIHLVVNSIAMVRTTNKLERLTVPGIIISTAV